MSKSHAERAADDLVRRCLEDAALRVSPRIDAKHVARPAGQTRLVPASGFETLIQGA